MFNKYLIIGGIHVLLAAAGWTVERQSGVTTAQMQTTPIKIYPNPWRADRHPTPAMTFEMLPANSQIKIFTASGHWIKTLTPAGPSTSWDLTNDSHDLVASGIYLYLVTTPDGEKSRGSLAVIR